LASPVSPSHEETRYRRRAKIICTIGPACGNEDMVRDLLRCGMDVARVNFSHGTHEDHAQRIALLRRVAAEQGRTICILQDLQGPKIRTGKLEGRKPILLEAGKQITITPRDIAGTPQLIGTTFKTLAKDVEPGARILFSDGRIELRVASVQGSDVTCDIINGGMLAESQGINIPGAALSVPALTEKDHEDLAFGLKNDVDMIAVSFVRTGADIRLVKDLIQQEGKRTPVIAKLEKPQAIENLEEILEAASGVMVARGDLGVELPAERVPVIQKHIIQRAAEWRKPVIIATQMLESMIENPRPTRAEASDVANAVFDGTDAVMLSGETATGKYPREAVNMMSRIILEAESSMAQQRLTRRRRGPGKSTISETICESIAHAAEDLDMGAIAVFTQSGHTAKLVSKYRPKCPIFAFARTAPVCNWMNLLWGVYPMMAGSSNSGESMVSEAESVLLHGGRVRIGEVIGVVAGTQMASGSTDFMRLHVVQAPPKQEFGH
jgi:pyruvate kinase